MWGSDLIVFLPVVGAIAGAFVGAVGTGLIRAWQDKKARDQERKSLLVLIDAELRSNAMYLEAVPVGTPSGPIRNLRTSAWDKAQVRLAQLLPVGDMKDLTLYYELVRLQQISPPADKKTTDEMTEDDWEEIERLQALGGTIIRKAQEYIQDPEFVDMLEVIEQCRTDINGNGDRVRPAR